MREENLRAGQIRVVVHPFKIVAVERIIADEHKMTTAAAGEMANELLPRGARANRWPTDENDRESARDDLGNHSYSENGW